jgi:hypothetical protein
LSVKKVVVVGAEGVTAVKRIVLNPEGVEPENSR